MGKFNRNILCLSEMICMTVILWRIIAKCDVTILLNIQENVSMIGDRRGLYTIENQKSCTTLYLTIFYYQLELFVFLTLFLTNSNIKSLTLQQILVSMIMQNFWGKKCKIAHFEKKKKG